MPSVCWKIIVALPAGESDLQRIDVNTRVIAVAMPNRDQKEIADSRWAQWITTVAQIEKTTKYNFFSNLPKAVQQALESRKDSGRGSRAATNGGAATGGVARATRQTQRPARTVRIDPPAPVYQPQTAPRDAAPEVMPRGPDTGTGIAQGAGAQVWVNTKSGVYHYEGARWYGNTKEGVYLSEAEAQAQGYRAARNGQ